MRWSCRDVAKGTKINGVDMTGKVKKLGGATNLPNYYYLFTPKANGDGEFVFTFQQGGSSTNQGEQLMRDLLVVPFSTLSHG